MFIKCVTMVAKKKSLRAPAKKVKAKTAVKKSPHKKVACLSATAAANMLTIPTLKRIIRERLPKKKERAKTEYQLYMGKELKKAYSVGDTKAQRKSKFRETAKAWTAAKKKSAAAAAAAAKSDAAPKKKSPKKKSAAAAGKQTKFAGKHTRFE